MATVQPDTIDLFFTESKQASDDLADVLKTYRSNVVTVLALATGAATFFGFDKTAKGPWYVAALVLYALAALAAVPILWPHGWVSNPASDFAAGLQQDSAMSKTKAQWDLGLAYQNAFSANSAVLHAIARWFQLVITLVVAVVVCAGVNSTIRHPEVPDKPTHIVIDGK